MTTTNPETGKKVENPFEGYRPFRVKVIKEFTSETARGYWIEKVYALENFPEILRKIVLGEDYQSLSMTYPQLVQICTAVHMAEVQMAAWASVGENCLRPGYIFKSNAFSNIKVIFQLEKIDESV